MHKVYLLLRNNKQQGPYSLDELLQLSLKPFDLVWVEGRSAGWKYPSEIENLKPYLEPETVPVPATEPLKQTTEPVISPEVSVSETRPVIEKVKPVPGKQVYVRLPGGMAPAESVPQEESPSDKLQRKAEELYQRAQAYASGQPAVEADPELDTKYSRSLDDIKEEYSNWLYNQRQGRKRISYKKPLKTLAVLAGAAVVFAGIYFLVFDNQEPGVLPDQLSMLPVSTAQKTPEKKILNKPKKKIIPVKKKSTSRKTTNVKPSKTSGIPSTTPVKKTTTTENKEETPAPVVEKKKAGFLPDLVKIRSNFSPDDERGIAEFPITVSNNSDEFLRFVAVDIFYLRNNGRQLEKKTIYFNNIPAHQSLTLTAPSHKKAEDVRLQMGLLSSDGGIYYSRD